jgi:hypothetical protein
VVRVVYYLRFKIKRSFKKDLFITYDIENAEYLWRERILSLDEKLRFILGIIIFSDRV